ncbi:tetratricopeptide repeat protein [Streptomyces sp. B1866]|uniref:tetratricopeptide repeat protein n=1 Tax=Streptomyces sp. B1866 TaxID=3075431 RepID=UPI0028926DD8|nr:tetratricopeptide repeat protein [Streptomyces sp. B1866]MDT3400273.1 tetratricopeptide repeat protein [Streptomyces sp. B1866]
MLALRADIRRAGLDTLSGRKSARSRVLLIAGRPGSGRTALAEELVRRVADEYPDGVLRARLSTADGTPVPLEQTARRLLGALGVPAVPGSAEDDLTEAARGALAGRRAVLLLDDVPGADQVDALLPDAPDSLVVAVARGPLTGIPDVRPCALGGLDLRAAIGLLTQFAGATRVTCDPTAADALVELCGGQPAALVIVGGWLAARPEASVADAVRRLRELPPPTGEPDQAGQPLARAFELAYGALPASAARLLRLLVLAPGCAADAHTASALAGCSLATARTTLEDFAALGLLRRRGVRPEAAQYEVPGCLEPLMRARLDTHERQAEQRLARARMLERTVRQLQACRLAVAPPGSAGRRKLNDLPRTLRFGSPGSAADWLQARLPALPDAARLAAEDGELDTLARRLVSALAQALTAHRGAVGAAPELYGLHELLLGAARRRGESGEAAAALLNLGDLDVRAGRARQALTRYREALEAARTAGDPVPTGRALESMGRTYQELGDWHRAADWYGRALELRLARREPADEARLYGRLGAVHGRAGRWAEALRDWRAAAAVCRRVDDLSGYARALGHVGEAQERTGRPREALRTCLEAIGHARKLKDARLQAAVSLRIAHLLDGLGDREAALGYRSAAGRLLARQRPPLPGQQPPDGRDPAPTPEAAYETSGKTAND